METLNLDNEEELKEFIQWLKSDSKSSKLYPKLINHPKLRSYRGIYHKELKSVLLTLYLRHRCSWVNKQSQCRTEYQPQQQYDLFDIDENILNYLDKEAKLMLNVTELEFTWPAVSLANKFNLWGLVELTENVVLIVIVVLIPSSIL